MIQCLACNDLVKYTSWPYHCNKNHSCPYISKKKHPHIEVDEKNKNDDDDDEDESNREVKDREKRPEKPAKRRLSEPKPICTINPNEKKVSPKTKEAKSTPCIERKVVHSVMKARLQHSFDGHHARDTSIFLHIFSLQHFNF